MLDELKEDIKQYNEIVIQYSNLLSDDFETAYELAKLCLTVANRWNEIMLDSAKYCSLVEVNVTRFEKWAYHKYRILSMMHEFCRVVWRQGKENYNNSFNNEM